MEPLRERVDQILSVLVGYKALGPALLAAIMQAVEEDRAALVATIELLTEQGKVDRASAQYCPSCGWLAPGHARGCGNPIARAEAAEAREAKLREAIEWALWERDDFPQRQPGDGEYWWRTELRRRAALAVKEDPMDGTRETDAGGNRV